MCILFVFSDPEPDQNGYRLIIASNRDESYRRPAKKVFHCPQSNIIGGRDMESGREGGMWLGVSSKFHKIKFAALLNAHAQNHKANAKGRGPLVPNYLESTDNAEEFLQNLDSNSFNSFYLFILEITNSTSLAYHHGNSPENTLKFEGKQLLAFGNSRPENPLTKVKQGRILFERIIKQHGNDRDKLVEDLLGLLKSQECHLPDSQLEERSPQYFQKLSKIFVDCKEAGYGTRTHSIILVDADLNLEFIEHTMQEPICVEDPKWDITVIKSKLTE